MRSAKWFEEEIMPIKSSIELVGKGRDFQLSDISNIWTGEKLGWEAGREVAISEYTSTSPFIANPVASSRVKPWRTNQLFYNKITLQHLTLDDTFYTISREWVIYIGVKLSSYLPDDMEMKLCASPQHRYDILQDQLVLLTQTVFLPQKEKTMLSLASLHDLWISSAKKLF